MAIHLLGTSHISPKSAEAVKKAINTGKYGIVAVELDRPRLEKLLSGDKRQPPFMMMARQVGFSGALLVKVGYWVERKLGGRIGMEPGEEMKTAYEACQERKIRMALIDQPIQVTLRRFSQEFTFKEKLRFFVNAFRFTRIKFDLKEVPGQELVERLLEELDRLSPALAKVLVHERNAYMAKKLLVIQQHYPEQDILAVVGAAHVPGLQGFIKDLSHRAPDGVN